jgi:serine/threonine protein phosphatase PrpC
MERPPDIELLHVHALTDTGTVRAHNEDAWLIDRTLGLAAVADGMGGHHAGAAASAGALAALQAGLATAPDGLRAAAVDPDATTVNGRWRQAVALRQALDQANATLYAENRRHGRVDGTGMGCTLTGFQVLPGNAALTAFHVGDSRLYRYRDGVLVQLTRDQTAYQLALESGAPGALPPPNLLLQAVGPTASITPDIALHDARPGDVLLLCSDGLHGWVPHAELEATLARHATPLPALCVALIACAKAHGSRDNITALVARL